MTDPIADMFNRIRNAQAVLKEAVSVPFSNLKYEITKILQREGFIEKAEKKGKTTKKVIEITLKYENKELAMRTDIEIVYEFLDGMHPYLKKLKELVLSRGAAITVPSPESFREMYSRPVIRELFYTRVDTGGEQVTYEVEVPIRKIAYIISTAEKEDLPSLIDRYIVCFAHELGHVIDLQSCFSGQDRYELFCCANKGKRCMVSEIRAFKNAKETLRSIAEPEDYARLCAALKIMAKNYILCSDFSFCHSSLENGECLVKDFFDREIDSLFNSP